MVKNTNILFFLNIPIKALLHFNKNMLNAGVFRPHTSQAHVSVFR